MKSEDLLRPVKVVPGALLFTLFYHIIPVRCELLPRLLLAFMAGNKWKIFFH